jgi:ribosomal protein S18 acetylase RimI-like enzyme
MIPVKVLDAVFEIRPVDRENLEAVLAVYRGCEDFLALGPIAVASMGMVLTDLMLSQGEGGVFCGIHRADGEMIGVVDYVPQGYHGDPLAAYLALLMIAAPHRSQGIGGAVVAAVEDEIRKDGRVTVIWSGVQVNNPQAIRFWQRQGYRIVSEPKLHSDGTTAVDLRKDLKRA